MHSHQSYNKRSKQAVCCFHLTKYHPKLAKLSAATHRLWVEHQICEITGLTFDCVNLMENVKLKELYLIKILMQQGICMNYFLMN